MNTYSGNIQIVGVPGSGKTTIIQGLLKFISENDHILYEKIKIFEFGNELKKILKEQGNTLSDGNIPNSDVIQAVVDKCINESQSSLTLMSGHLVHFNYKDGEYQIKKEIDIALQPSAYVFLYSDPKQIAERKKSDLNRKREIGTSLQILEHQGLTYTIAKNLSNEVGGVFYEIENSEGEEEFAIKQLYLIIKNVIESNGKKTDFFKESVGLIDEERKLNNKVKAIDPFDLNHFIQKLGILDEKDKIETILYKLNEIVELINYEILGIEESLGGLRDLGFLCAILTKNQIKIPVAVQEFMFRLSNICGEVPRDTVYSYGPRNNELSLRIFTSLPEERIFIDSFKYAIDGLYDCVQNLLQWRSGNSESLANSRLSFQKMIDGILSTRKHITPDLFTNQLRPYFDPYEIKGLDYLAPGGAQMPLLLIDLILRGGGNKDVKYLKYVQENLQYCSLIMRKLGNKLLNHQSVIEDLNLFNSFNATELKQIIEILNGMISFRMPHLKIAEANFKLRGSGEVGSGGYNPEILYFLIEKTKATKEVCQKRLLEIGT